MSHGVVEVSTARRTAYALAVLGLPVVYRGTLRSLLPTGRARNIGVTGHLNSVRNDNGTGRVNVVSRKFQTALHDFEREGWITRGTEFVAVRDARALLDFALADLGDKPSILLAIELAAEAVRRDLNEATDRSAAYVEQRRRELIALKRLMEQGFGENWSGRGAVRYVPRSKVL